MPGVPMGLIAERRLLDRLMSRDAVTSSSAIQLEGLSWPQARAFRRLQAKNVIREASPGSFYLSAPDYVAHARARRIRAVIMIIVVSVTMALLAGTAMRIKL